MKKIFALMLCLFMIVGITACGSSKKQPDDSQTNNVDTSKADTNTDAGNDATGDSDTIEAREEMTGNVVIYTSMYEDIVEAMDNQLKEVFPEMNIEFFQGGTGTLQSKIAAEIDSGKLSCDLIMVAEPSYALELKEEGVLHSFKYEEAEKLLFDYDADGYWYPVRCLNMVLAYNPDLYSKDQVSNSYEDFAVNPDLKGYISMGNPLTSGTSYAAVVALLDEYGEEYLEKLGSQGVAIESGSVSLTKLETGECKEIMVLEESVLKKREEEGSNLEVIYPTDGTISSPSPIMIINDEYSANKNAKAAEAVQEWFLSLEGQKYIVSGWMHSVRSDYPSAPYDAIPTKEVLDNTIKVDWDKAFKDREEIRTVFQEHVTIPQ